MSHIDDHMEAWNRGYEACRANHRGNGTFLLTIGFVLGAFVVGFVVSIVGVSS